MRKTKPPSRGPINEPIIIKSQDEFDRYFDPKDTYRMRTLKEFPTPEDIKRYLKHRA